MQTISTFLPIFTGFYCNPCFDTTDEEIRTLDDLNDERKNNKLQAIHNTDPLIFNYKQLHEEIGAYCCETVANSMQEFVSSIVFEKINSPREYNFTNDAIYCKISYHKEAIQKYLHKHMQAFATYIKDNYTSCSGFHSWHSANYRDWLMIAYFDRYNDDPHYLGSILQFIAQNEKINEDIFDEWHCNISLDCTNYDVLTTKPINEIN